TVKAKKYFYVLRPLLACRHILRNNTPPPMLFSELAETQLEPALRPVVDELVRAKMQQPEIGTGKRIDVLNEYIDRSLTEIEALLSEMPDEPPGDRDELERLFADIVLTEK
ncbi:MAG: nucleotidyltransferase domain-containing protein, partial [Oscillospiraceae bacterium]|nr:nucleotidyltransferase domain-containing protein [Oscillospiraceae bacterium]